MTLTVEDLSAQERFMIARRRADVTQAKLARLTGISQSRISKWEIGKANLTPEQVKVMWEVLG